MNKILIADDESNILMLLEVMLNEIDAEIITAENGEIAIEKAFETKPDLIISDVVMPKKNGFEVCRAVRNNPEIEDIPIILLSALGDEYNKVAGFEEGADDYVIKPFNIEELKTKAETLLTRYKSKLKHDANQEHTESIIVDKNVERVPTGKAELDELLYGGLPLGSNILLTGSLGTGKSSLCRSFIKNGLDKGENALFVALDDDPSRVRQNLYANGINYEESNQLRFVDAYSWSSMSPNENELFAVKGSLELNQLSGLISDASYEIGQTPQVQEGGRRVIDSISSLLINFELSDAQRFLNQIARTSVAFGNVTTLFIIEEGTIDETILNNIKYIMDGVIELKSENQERFCRVASMKWAQFKPHWITIN
ncbi:MAG: hypothetical protein CMP39_01020 [Rickettsiales bacterium]|nr:hypothetical protein [Rickettsiales bacterium]|tara:strand:+ start:8439 stop:9545 length:1107 start_codon:yes stop_codon:yes gene_type:complete